MTSKSYLLLLMMMMMMMMMMMFWWQWWYVFPGIPAEDNRSSWQRGCHQRFHWLSSPAISQRSLDANAPAPRLQGTTTACSTGETQWQETASGKVVCLYIGGSKGVNPAMPPLPSWVLYLPVSLYCRFGVTYLNLVTTGNNHRVGISLVA